MLVDVDTLLQIDQHGHCRHEGERRVQDDAKDVQLWRERRGNYNKLAVLKFELRSWTPTHPGCSPEAEPRWDL